MRPPQLAILVEDRQVSREGTPSPCRSDWDQNPGNPCFPTCYTIGEAEAGLDSRGGPSSCGRACELTFFCYRYCRYNLKRKIFEEVHEVGGQEKGTNRNKDKEST